MEKVVRKFRSLQEADDAEHEYYASLTPLECLDIMIALCYNPEAFIERPKSAADAQRLARVYRPSGALLRGREG